MVLKELKYRLGVLDAKEDLYDYVNYHQSDWKMGLKNSQSSEFLTSGSAGSGVVIIYDNCIEEEFLRLSAQTWNKQKYSDNFSAKVNELRSGNFTNALLARVVERAKQLRKNWYELKRALYLKDLRTLELEYYSDLLSPVAKVNVRYEHQNLGPQFQEPLSVAERYRTVDRLVQLSTRLISGGNSDDEIEFTKLEKKLLFFKQNTVVAESENDCDFESIYPVAIEAIVNRYMGQLGNEISLLIALIKANNKFLFINLKSDLRSRYRSIVRFHYKCMDDESGDFSNYVALFRNILLNRFKHYYNEDDELEGNDFTFKINRQKQVACYLN